VSDVVVLVAALVGGIVGGTVGHRRTKRMRAALTTLKEMRAAFTELDVTYQVPGEADAAAIAKLDAAPHSQSLSDRWRHVGDRVHYHKGKRAGATRIFVDHAGKVVAVLMERTNEIAVPCHMYSFTRDTEYWTLPFTYRGLALGPAVRTANGSVTLDVMHAKHRELIRDADDLLVLTSADDVTAQWKRSFQSVVTWRAALDEAALYDADALSLAGGNPRIARRIAKRMQAEVPAARLLR
jgi:hypothetical protein